MNRRLIVVIQDDRLICLKVGGMLSDSHPYSSIVNSILSSIQVNDEKYNSLRYIQTSYIKKYANVDINSDVLLSLDKNNMKINFEQIRQVRKNTRWKWGMGSVPYTGRILVDTFNKKYEFIVLGKQNLDDIYQKIIFNMKG